MVTHVAEPPERLPARSASRSTTGCRYVVLEERLITMYKQGDGFFWIGRSG